MASYVRYFDKDKGKWVRKEVKSSKERKSTVRSALRKSVEFEVRKKRRQQQEKAIAEAGETRVTRDPTTRKYTLTTIKDGTTTSRTLTAAEFKAEDEAAYRQALAATTRTETSGTIGAGTQAVGLGRYGEKITLTRSKISETDPQVQFQGEVFRVASKRSLKRKTDSGIVTVDIVGKEQQEQLGRIREDAKPKSYRTGTLSPLDPDLKTRRLSGLERTGLALEKTASKIDELSGTARTYAEILTPKIPKGTEEFRVSSAVATATPVGAITKAPVLLRQGARLVGGFAGAEQIRSTPEQTLRIIETPLTQREQVLISIGLAAQSKAAREKGFFSGLLEENILLTGSREAFRKSIKATQPSITEKELKRLERFRTAKGVGEVGAITFLGATTEVVGRAAFSQAYKGVALGSRGLDIGRITATNIARQSAKITGTLGVYEGLAVQELQSRTRGTKLSASERVVMGGLSGLTAGAFGYGIGYGVGSRAIRFAESPLRRTRGEIIGRAATIGGYVLDPLEKAGDITADLIQRASRRSAAFVPETAFVRRGSRAVGGVVTFTQSQAQAPKRRARKVKIDTFSQLSQPLNAFSQTNLMNNLKSQTQILSAATSVNIPVPITTTTSSPVSTFTQINIPTTVQTQTQTSIPVTTQTQTQTNIPVSVNIPTINADLPFIPLGGFGGFGRYKRRGRKQRTGFELQGLSSLQKFVATGTSRKGKRKVFK